MQQLRLLEEPTGEPIGKPLCFILKFVSGTYNEEKLTDAIFIEADRVAKEYPTEANAILLGFPQIVTTANTPRDFIKICIAVQRYKA